MNANQAIKARMCQTCGAVLLTDAAGLRAHRCDVRADEGTTETDAARSPAPSHPDGGDRENPSS